METKKSLVTYESVAAAATHLKSTGQNPTVRAIISELGGGSPNAIQPLLRDWKAGTTPTKKEALPVDPRITQILAEQVNTAVMEATADAEILIADLNKDLDAIADAGLKSEELVKTLEQELTETKNLNQQLMGEVRSLKLEINSAQTKVENDIEKANNEKSEYKKSANESLVKIAQLEMQIKEIDSLKLEIINLRESVKSENELRVEQEKIAAVKLAEYVQVSKSYDRLELVERELNISIKKLRTTIETKEKTILNLMREMTKIKQQIPVSMEEPERKEKITAQKTLPSRKKSSPKIPDNT